MLSLSKTFALASLIPGLLFVCSEQFKVHFSMLTFVLAIILNSFLTFVEQLANSISSLIEQYSGWGGLRSAIYDRHIFCQLKFDCGLSDVEIASIKAFYGKPPKMGSWVPRKFNILINQGLFSVQNRAIQWFYQYQLPQHSQ